MASLTFFAMCPFCCIGALLMSVFTESECSKEESPQQMPPLFGVGAAAGLFVIIPVGEIDTFRVFFRMNNSFLGILSLKLFTSWFPAVYETFDLEGSSEISVCLLIVFRSLANIMLVFNLFVCQILWIPFAPEPFLSRPHNLIVNNDYRAEGAKITQNLIKCSNWNFFINKSAGKNKIAIELLWEC